MLHPRPQLRLNLALGTCRIGQVGLRPLGLLTCGLLTCGPLACVLPRDTATGIELRWRLPEGNRADPSTAPGDRLRTCSGARVARVRALLVDRADRERRRSFEYPCNAGDDPPADRVIEPAEIFIDLRPGNYDLELRWHDAADRELGQRQDTVQVEQDTLLPLDLELPGPLLPWTLELHGTAACTQLGLEIFYADPSQDLHALPDAAEGRYRGDLVSDGGLALAEPLAPLACDALVDGPQVFRDLDRGAYRLRLTVDGRACELDFLVDAAAPPLAVDLAKPGCAG